MSLIFCSVPARHPSPVSTRSEWDAGARIRDNIFILDSNTKREDIFSKEKEERVILSFEVFIPDTH